MGNISLYDYCVANGREDLLKQWHPTKNGRLRPDAVTAFANIKVWWICDKGHEYEARISNRTYKNSGCTYCAGNNVTLPDQSLAALRPDIAAQWHPTKNGDLRPDQVSIGSGKKVWWICEEGHEYEMQVRHRANGSGCSVCAGRVVIPGVNDMASQFPLIAAQWHPTLNGELRPDQVTPYSNKNVWWLCENGHEYQRKVNYRTGQNLGCKLCSRMGRKKRYNK